MASQRAKFAVGLFVVSGIVIAVLAVIWLGMSHFLQEGEHYVTFFNESVQGLDKDSPVQYRGVPIGRVESISVAPDEKVIQVVLKIESGQKLGHDIVAQLKTVGITGTMLVELDRKEKNEPDQSPLFAFPTQYPIVASKPSDIKELLKGVDDFLNLVRSFDVKEISEKIKLTLDNVNQKVSDANVKGISKEIAKSLERIDKILDDEKWDGIMASIEDAGQSLNTLMGKADTSLGHMENTLVRVEGIVAGKEKEIKEAIEGFKQAMENANSVLERGHSLVSGTDDSVSHLRQYLLVIAQNLENASENLDRLAELLAEQPSQLIFGEPPKPRNVEKGVQ